MKTLILFFGLILTTVAAAETVLVLEAPAGSHSEYAAALDVNKKLGRAWVVVTETSYTFGDAHYTDKRVLVPGLSYDQATKEVIYTLGTERIVCSNLYNQRWVIDIGGSLHDTGRCRFAVEVVKIQKDDGFEIESKKVVQVNLIIE